MLATKAVWAALVTVVKALGKFQDVRAYPFHRVNDAAFLKDFPGLKLPACLVVRLGKTDTAKGQALERETRWSFVIVCKDADGSAWEAACDLEDAVTDDVLDKQILAGELTIYGSNEVGIALTSPRFAVSEISATTRELGVRE